MLKMCPVDQRAERHPSKIDENGSATTSSAPSHTKILSKRLNLKAVHEARVKIVARV